MIEDILFRGLMALAALHPGYPCTQLLDTLSHSDTPAVEVLWGTFSKPKRNFDKLACLKRLTAKFANKPHYVEFSLSNESGRRTRKHFGLGELFPSLTFGELNKRLRQRDHKVYVAIGKRVNDILDACLAIRNPFTTCALSSGLESSYSHDAWRELSRFLRARWPFLLVHNPLYDRDDNVQVADLIERHTSGTALARRPAVVSNDGSTLDSRGLRALYAKNKSARVLLFWDSASQGRESLGYKRFTFPAPRGRTFRFNRSYRRTVGALLEDRR